MASAPPRSSAAVRLGWLAAGVVLGVAAMAFVRPASASLDRTSDPCPKPDSFREVYRHVRNLALVEPDENRLYDAAVGGMLSSLDPWTQLISPEDWKAMNQASRGEVVGVGVEFEEKRGALVTTAPVASSPAAKAGLHAGELVLAVNGRNARTLTAGEATLALFGAAGTKVSLRLVEKDGAAPAEVTLERARGEQPNVDVRLGATDLAYVRLGLFGDGVAAEVKSRLPAVRAQAGAAFKGLIIDLRHNPGGLLEEAVSLADVFVKDGPLVTATERKGRHAQEMRASGAASETGYPIVLVVDGTTASAAEAFTAALREHGRAIVIGARTFGKGTVQDYIPLEDGSALKITKAQYLTPSGRSLNGHGIEPDVPVVQKEGRTEDAFLKVAAYVVRNWTRFSPKLDKAPVLAAP